MPPANNHDARRAGYAVAAALLLLAGCATPPPPSPPAPPTVPLAAAHAAELDALRAMSAFRAELLAARLDRRPPDLAASRRAFAAAHARLRPADGTLPNRTLEPRALLYDGVLDAMDRIAAATTAGDPAARDLGLAIFDDALARLATREAR